MQQELTATSILALFETTKAQRADFIQRITDAVIAGEISPLKVHLQLKAMEEIAFGLTSTDEKKNRLNFKNAVIYRKELLDDAERHGKSFELYNASFSIKEVGTKYDYSNTNDTTFEELKAAAEKANKALEQRQKFLQNLPDGGITEVNEETAEAIQLYRPIKKSTTAVVVALK